MPSDLNKSRGVIVETGPLGTVEQETFTCAHCNVLVPVKHRAAPDECGGLCMHCMAMVCTTCQRHGTCTPFEKKLVAYERRQSLFAAAGL